jgi:uncharacterized protein involved in exopolysaccharide biosynthesis
MEPGAIDPAILLAIARRRWRLWLVQGIGVFALVAVAGLLSFPGRYTATVSIALQRPDPGPLSLLSLTGEPQKSYRGVLKSRRFAERVDRSVHFRVAMGAWHAPPPQAEAVDAVSRDLLVEDNPKTGLMYVTVSLHGPPRLWPDPGNAKRGLVGASVARAANLYSDSLADYLKNTDTDKELAQLRAAWEHVAKAESEYTAAMQRLAAFVRGTKLNVVPTGGTSSTASETGQVTARTITLYERRADLAATLSALDSMRAGRRLLLANGSRGLTALPEEDPLLATARGRTLAAQTRLQRLQIMYGDAMPSVQRAKARLKLAERALDARVAAILHGDTSDDLKRQAIQAEYDTVERQIRQAERDFQANRLLGVHAERLQNDVTLKLETLKAVAVQYAELKLKTVSAQDRMVVVDPARPPTSVGPGIAQTLAVALLAGALYVAIRWILETVRTTERTEQRSIPSW